MKISALLKQVRKEAIWKYRDEAYTALFRVHYTDEVTVTLKDETAAFLTNFVNETTDHVTSTDELLKLAAEEAERRGL